KILKNIDFSDKSLQTGISGIGISLLHSYSIRKDDRVKKVIKDIKVNLNNASIKDFDNTLENGKLGIALFYIYHYHIFESNSSLSKAIEYLDDVLLEFQDSKYKKSLAKNINSEFYEYYIANGICGLILVLIEFMQKTNDSRYFSKMEYFAKLCKGIYSTSPCFLSGSAGFLYTFYKIYKNFKLNKEF
ncbi:TPA: lanthionine synthetase LanC family protein, partial [Streptococcus suis]